MELLERIKTLLDDNGAEYELIKHKKAVTSEEAEKLTGWPMSSGAKSILFKMDKEFVLCIVKGTNRVDFKKLRDISKIRKARLAKPEEVEKVMGVEIGACYPFPEIAGVKGWVDETLAENELISFSPGTHVHHIRMKWADYKRITKPKLVDLRITFDEN